MPSRRHSAAIDSSPRRPSSTMRIFSSAEYCLRVARRMSLMTCSAGAFPVPGFCLIFAPLKGYDEPEILRSQLNHFGPISADAGQARDRSHFLGAAGIHSLELGEAGKRRDQKL